MNKKENNKGVSEQAHNNMPDNPRDLSERIISSASTLTSSFGGLNTLQNLDFSEEKGSSSNYGFTREISEESQKISSEIVSSDFSKGLTGQQFSSRSIVDFDIQEPSPDIHRPMHSETLNDSLMEASSQANSSMEADHSSSLGDYNLEGLSHEEKIKRYRDSVKNKSSKAEESIENEYGYFEGKFMSSQEVVGILNEQHLKKTNIIPTHLPDFMEDDFIEDGEDVVRLLNEPFNDEELTEEFNISSQLLALEESDFKALLTMKYDHSENVPEDAIEYLDGFEYLEDIYGLPELHGKITQVFKDPGLTVQDKRKALERLVKLKNQISEAKSVES